jgi:hypothetical protein
LNSWQQCFSFTASAVAIAFVLQNAGLCKDFQPSFYEVVQQNFNKWDLNHDGMLDSQEIQKAFKNPKYTGDAAAAISVLKKIETSHFHEHEPLQSFTLEQILEMQNKGNPRRKKNKKVFENTLKKIDAESTQLYAHGLPKIDEIKQGATSDCYFLSVVGALVLAHPEKIKDMIETNPDGRSYTVYFKGAKPVKVDRPSAGECAAYNSNGGDGIWLPVLLKAYGRLKMRTGEYNDVPLDPVERTVVHGGVPAKVVTLFTGHATSKKHPRECRDLRQWLSDAFERKRVVIVSVPGHAMAGVAYDRKSDQLEIWNPWGSSKTYKPLGAEMQNGFFAVPISEVREKCRSITIELSENADSNKVPGNHHKHHHGG